MWLHDLFLNPLMSGEQSSIVQKQGQTRLHSSSPGWIWKSLFSRNKLMFLISPVFFFSFFWASHYKCITILCLNYLNRLRKGDSDPTGFKTKSLHRLKDTQTNTHTVTSAALLTQIGPFQSIPWILGSMWAFLTGDSWTWASATPASPLVCCEKGLCYPRQKIQGMRWQLLKPPVYDLHCREWYG